MTNAIPNTDIHHTDSDHTNTQEAPKLGKKSRFSPTSKGVFIGAVAGSILPIFGTLSGAIIGGIAGKVYEKKCCSPKA